MSEPRWQREARVATAKAALLTWARQLSEPTNWTTYYEFCMLEHIEHGEQLMTAYRKAVDP
jgi:hypothetical protein